MLAIWRWFWAGPATVKIWAVTEHQITTAMAAKVDVYKALFCMYDTCKTTLCIHWSDFVARPLSLAEHTLLAELVEKSLDAMFDEQFPENGSFIVRSVKNREGLERNYIYYQGYRPKASPDDKSTRYQRYVGPADDPAIAERVARFQDIKSGRKERAALVQGLTGIGLPRPPVQMGRITEALAKAGLFRMRAVLVGTAAFQTYPAIIGMRLDDSAAITGDVDVAQFRSISLSIEDRTPPILEILQKVDPSFRAIPHRNDPIAATAFQNGSGFRLDILTPHRGSDDQIGKALKMDAMNGAAAEPLRFLDFLIYKPVRSVMLFGSGISVNVPAPERFAIHKLIVSTRRKTDLVGTAKSRKDVAQSNELISSLDHIGQLESLSQAFGEAWERGPRWRQGIEKGASRLPDAGWAILSKAASGKLPASKPKLPPYQRKEDEALIRE